MKKALIILSSSLFLIAACAQQHHSQQKAMKPTQLQDSKVASSKLEQISIYAKPDSHSAVVEEIHIGQPLVPIYRHKGWEKVANRRNGNVGWVNIKQYRHAWHQAMQPDIQTVYVSSEQAKPGQKAKMTVVAYRNGKKISDKEAQKIYQHLQRQQRVMQKQWKRFDLEMGQQERLIDSQLNSLVQPLPLWQPVIVVHDK